MERQGLLVSLTGGRTWRNHRKDMLSWKALQAFLVRMEHRIGGLGLELSRDAKEEDRL